MSFDPRIALLISDALYILSTAVFLICGGYAALLVTRGILGKDSE